MSNDITNIQHKYGVSANGAELILETTLHHPEIGLNQVVTIYRYLAANSDGVVTSRIMRNAIASYAANKLSNARSKIPGDNLSTRGFMRPGKYDEHGNRPLERDKKKQRTYLPLHKLINNDMSHEIPLPDKIEPPKYYYLELDEKFNYRGKEKPPTQDPQFQGNGAIVPFIKVTHIKTISPSRREVPLFKNGQPDGMGIREGKRYYEFDTQFKGQSQKNIVEIDYFDNVGMDSSIGRDQLLKEVREILLQLMTPKLFEIYKLIREDKPILTRESIKKFDKNVFSHMVLDSYYGKDFKNDRKKKSIKPSPKRKTIVKKLIKKCNCNPIQKRKLLSTKKKIARGRK